MGVEYYGGKYGPLVFCLLLEENHRYKTYLSSFFFPPHLQLQIARTTVDERACDTSPLTHGGTCCHPTIATILKGNLIVAISLFAIMAVAVEPTFRPSGATNHWKNIVFCDFSTFSRTCIFFLLTLSLL